jgi:hypothetical protein
MRRSPAIRLVLLTALVVVLCSATAATAAVHTSTGIAGTWSGKYSGAYSGTFTLRWRLVRSILRGTITLSNPHGSYGITGSVNRGTIKFGVVKVGATYTGLVFGNKMSGSYKTPGGGGSWSAHKVIVR